MKTLRIFFYIFLVSLFTGEIFRLQFGDIAITLRDISLVLLIIIWLVLILTKRIALSSQKKLVTLGIFLGVCTLSLIWNAHVLSSNQLLVAFLYMLRWGAYACLYPIVLSFSKHENKRIENWIEILGVGVSILGFVQLIFYPNLRNLYYLGWDEHLYRLFSVFLDPNFAGVFFALFDLLVIYRLLKDWNAQKVRYFHVAAFLISTFALIFTFSRSGMILFVVGMTVYLTLYKKMKYVLVLIAGLTLIYLLESSHFHIENINLFRGTSSEARVQTAQTALMIFSKNPILGVGFDAYRYAQIHYGYRPDTTVYVSHADAGTDNSFLFVLATTGVVGFFAYLWMWNSLLTHSGDPGSRSGMIMHFRLLVKTPVGKLIVSSVLGLFVSALFINALFYPFLMGYMWILLGITAGERS